MRTVEEMTTEYANGSSKGILLGWNAERAAGQPKLEDVLMAKVCERQSSIDIVVSEELSQ